jgi:hypothetical protein
LLHPSDFRSVAKFYIWLAPEKVKLADHVAHALTEHAGEKRKHAQGEEETEPKDASATAGEAPPSAKKSKIDEADSQSRMHSLKAQ